jgi:hypothetical protein
MAHGEMFVEPSEGSITVFGGTSTTHADPKVRLQEGLSAQNRGILYFSNEDLG